MHSSSLVVSLQTSRCEPQPITLNLNNWKPSFISSTLSPQRSYKSRKVSSSQTPMLTINQLQSSSTRLNTAASCTFKIRSAPIFREFSKQEFLHIKQMEIRHQNWVNHKKILKNRYRFDSIYRMNIAINDALNDQREQAKYVEYEKPIHIEWNDLRYIYNENDTFWKRRYSTDDIKKEVPSYIHEKGIQFCMAPMKSQYVKADFNKFNNKIKLIKEIAVGEGRYASDELASHRNNTSLILKRSNKFFKHQIVTKLLNYFRDLKYSSISGKEVFDHKLFCTNAYIRPHSHEFFTALRSESIDLMEEIITLSPYILFDHNLLGQTPLHIAVRKGNARVIDVILNHKVNVNAKDGTGKTPLMIAASRDDYRAALV